MGWGAFSPCCRTLRYKQPGGQLSMIFMKRFLTVLLTLSVTLFSLALSACNSLTLPISIDQYENADAYSVGDQSYTGTLTEIDLDWALGYVELKQDNTIDRIVLTEKSENELHANKKVRSLFSDGKLTVKFWKSGYSAFVKDADKQLTISYPSSLSALTVNLGSGTLVISDTEIDTAVLNLASGSSEISSSTGSKLNINLASGKINAKSLDYDNVEIAVASGKCTIDDLTSANSVSANISEQLKLSARALSSVFFSFKM